MPTELWELSARELARRIQAREVSPVDVVDSVVTRMENVEPQVHAMTTMDTEGAIKEARRAEDLLGSPDADLGALHGIPLTIKDNVATEGLRTTLGSLAYADHVPDSDAPVVRLLRGSGAVNLGKTSLSEFGHKGVTDSLVSEPTRNPWDVSRTAGGSSGGAGAALAAGVAPLAVGTDGGGSIRVPAAFCGVVGIKPTIGSVPIYPPSVVGQLGHIGPMARTVEDAALMLSVMQGERRWPEGLLSSLDRAREGGLNELRVGVFQSADGVPVEPELLNAVASAARELEARGARIEFVDVPCEGFGAVWDTLFDHGMLRQIQQFEHVVDIQFSPSFQALVDCLSLSLGDAQRAEAERVRIARRVQRFFAPFDVLLGPTVSVPAFQLGIDDPPRIAGRDVAVRSWWRTTQLWNLTGNPACTVPAGLTASGLPMSIQLIGRLYGDFDVLRTAVMLERPFEFPNLTETH